MPQKTNFEDDLRELERIVRELENADVALDDAIELYEKGIMLSKRCSKKLSEAKQKITSLSEEEMKGNV